jgi:hypothetical protein
VLNDDLVILRPDIPSNAPRDALLSLNKWKAHSTPFWNPSQVPPTVGEAPLAAILHLAKDRAVFLEGMSQGQALAELLACTPLLPQDPGRSEALLERLTHLIQAVPVFQLHFLPDASFWNALAPLGLPKQLHAFQSGKPQGIFLA